MRAHCLQHVPFEGLGSIEQWLRSSGYEVTNTPFFQTTELPDLKNIDLLIVMGGPMSCEDKDEFPWLVQEKQFIRRAIEVGKPVLGVCLGAQLIANAMGAQIYLNPVKEIGWFPIQGFPPLVESTFSFPSLVDVFHWHSETFDLPSGAIHLARSEGCEKMTLYTIGAVIILRGLLLKNHLINPVLS